MANNVNTNLAQRLFAYIQHKADLTSYMTDVYKSSLIFVGDQKQIYVPLYNTYVGIGMDNYNAVVNRVSDVEQSIAELKQKSTVGVVTGAYVQRSSEHVDGLTATDIKDNKLGGDITFSGKGNYDQFTGFSYVHNLVYTYTTGQWSMVGTESGFVEDPDNGTAARSKANATSGIRLTYYVNYVDDVVDGIPVQKPAGHQLVIDDSMTWAYMTKAYDYTLTFTRNYTDDRVETIYRDLLGIGDSVLVPVTYSSMFIDNPSTGQPDFNGQEYYYWTGAGDPDMGLTTDPETGDLNIPAGWQTTSGTPVNDNKTYYILSTTYNNTYNMNIADGIQTLKEVAYILDQLSDGGLGSYTYISKTEWDDAASNGTWTLVGGAGNAYTSSANNYEGTYFRVITASGKPTTSEKNYAYYVKVNPENLGIQMAYSIAGNTADINDLHEHVELAEEGKTTTRSMSYINTANLATVSQWSHTIFSVTDSEQSLPEATYTGQSAYIVGDVISTVSLDLANTYLTYSYAMTVNGNVYNVSNVSEVIGVINDTERIGVFQKVNFVNDLPTFASNTYYRYDSSANTMTLLTSSPSGWPETRQQAAEWGDNNNYYWKPGDAYDYANATFEKTTAEHFAEHHTADDHYYTKDANDHYTYVTEPTAANVANYYVMTDDGEYYAQHAIIDTANHIATTAWVDAYYKDNQATITEQINDILDDAKEYTDQEIGKLDNNLQYSYAAFEKWMTTAYAGYSDLQTEVVGTTTYTDKRDNAFVEFISAVDSSAFNDATYYKNVLRSQYISNIVENNGVIEISETNELPTDQLEITKTVWNSYENNAVYDDITTVTDWTNLSASNSVNGADNSIDDVTEVFFAFAYNNGGTPRQIYYHPDSSTEKAYRMLIAGPDTAADGDYVLNNNGQYVTVSSLGATESGLVKEAFNSSNSAANAHWRQVYRGEVPYYEIKTSTVEAVSGDNNDKVCYIDYAGNEHEITIKTALDAHQLYIKRAATEKVEYLTGSIQHYSYTEVGGEGQNKVTLNVNITSIEDATPTNTGFADAYDVKDYIANMFTWVNLSANVSATAVSQTAAFYKAFKVEAKVSDYADANAAQTAAKNLVDEIYNNGGALYYNNSGTYTALTKEQADTTYLVEMKRTASGTPVATDNASAVTNSNFYTISVDGGEHQTPVYTTEQGVVENPINMATTKVGRQ